MASTDEMARLHALHGRRLLGSAPDPAFDDLTRLAAEICGAPTAVLALVDRDRIRFRARVGCGTEEVPRADGLCSEVVERRAAIVVPDLATDDRESSRRMTGPPLWARSYAGVPLLTAEGHALGALAVLDRVPRVLEPWQAASLGALARVAAREIDARRAGRDAEERRREAIGTLAGGLAHEFNALLTLMLRDGGTIDAGLDPSHPRHDTARRLLRAAGRAADLTRQLLALSRQPGRTPKVLDLNDLIARRGSSWRPRPGGGPRMDLRLDPALGRVRADEAQIDRALGDLVRHASGAVPEHGTVTVRTENLPGVACAGESAGSWVAVSVAGACEPSEWARPAFPDDGASLAGVRGILVQSGGRLEVERGPDLGTTLRVLLPRHAD